MLALQGFTWLLVLQSFGEMLARGLSLPLPGPVIGMLILLLSLRWPWVQVRVGAVAEFLLAHLSLLFVPVGVGVMMHVEVLARHGAGLLLIVLVSTWVSLATTAWVLQWLLRKHTDPPAAP